jgi:tetratricopeptide (TPR) repeat protein
MSVASVHASSPPPPRQPGSDRLSDPAPQRAVRGRRSLPAILLAAAAIGAFAASVPGEFVLDDVAFLPDSPRLAAVSNPLVFLETRVWDHAAVDVDAPLYRPAFVAALWAGSAVLGASPRAWHALVLLLHAACTLLVWRLARRLLPAAPPFAPLAGALLFAVHPVHTEAVAWILGFTHPLATLFALAAALAQVRHADRGRTADLAAAAAFSTAALLSNEVALVVPPLLVAVDAGVRGRPSGRVALVHLVPLAIVLGLRARILPEAVPLAPSAAGVRAAAEFGAAYVRQLLVGWPQHVHLSLPPGGVADPLAWLLAAGAVAASAWAAWRAPSEARSAVRVALAWCWGGLLPLAAAAMNPRPLFAPRALYLASAGLAVLAAWGVAGAVRRAPALARGTALGLAALGLVASNAFALGWTDNATVYARAAAADPSNLTVRLKRAEILAARGDQAGAESAYRSAAASATTAGHRLDALEALAAHLGALGRLDDAERALRDVVAAAPERSSAWVAMGNVAYHRGQLAAARDHYLRGHGLDPRNFEAAANLALVFSRLGEPELSREYGARAERLRARAAAPPGP